MTDSGETKTQRVRRNVIAGAIVGVLALSAAVGVPAVVNASNAAHAQEVQQIADAKAASVVVRADAARDAVLAGSASQAGVIAQQEAAAKAAALAAQQAAAAAAAQAAAQKAAQEAAARQTTQTTTQATQTTSSPAPIQYHGPQIWTGTQFPSGTNLPMIKDDDPNSGQYGQMVIEYDPASYCVTHSGTNRGGVPECT